MNNLIQAIEIRYLNTTHRNEEFNTTKNILDTTHRNEESNITIEMKNLLQPIGIKNPI